MWPAGTAWSPIRGVVGLGAGVSPGYQAGEDQCRGTRTAPRPMAPRVAGTTPGVPPDPIGGHGTREWRGAVAAPHEFDPRRPGFVPIP